MKIYNNYRASKGEKLFDAITDIRDDLITGAEQRPVIKKKRRKYLRTVAAAAALAFIIAGGAVIMPYFKKQDTPVTVPEQHAPYAVAVARYPEMAQYPDESKYIGADGIFDDDGFDIVYSAWHDSLNAQRRPDGYADGLEDFFSYSTRDFLSGENGENKLYSPLNVYMALAMLAETTGGSSRQQILDLLGCSDIDALRRQASDVWNATYRDDGAVASVLASSVWMSDRMEYNKETIDRLADTYYASSFSGEMGSEDYNQALRDWINRQTGDLLSSQAEGLEFSPDTILALASTVYFRSKWSTEYNEKTTLDGIFHGISGDVPARFMPRSDSADYFWGDNFTAIYQDLESRGRMWFILPDEDSSIQAVLDDGKYLLMTSDAQGWAQRKRLLVNSKLPKFDVSTGADLGEGLRRLGVTDVFDGSLSDFSPLSDQAQGAFLYSVSHDVRVAIDEEGVIAAAYTVMMDAGAAMPPDEQVDFIVDRPFIFVITTPDDLPLFVGAVYNI